MAIVNQFPSSGGSKTPTLSGSLPEWRGVYERQITGIYTNQEPTICTFTAIGTMNVTILYGGGYLQSRYDSTIRTGDKYIISSYSKYTGTLQDGDVISFTCKRYSYNGDNDNYVIFYLNGTPIGYKNGLSYDLFPMVYIYQEEIT